MFEKYRSILRHDPKGMDKVIRAIEYLRDAARAGKAEIECELGYFRKNRHRRRYAELAAQGIPIWSGVVEAASKRPVTQRMKRSGMRWSIEGGQSTLTFRARIKSGRFDAAWSLIMDSLPAAANDDAPGLPTCPFLPDPQSETLVYEMEAANCDLMLSHARFTPDPQSTSEVRDRVALHE